MKQTAVGNVACCRRMSVARATLAAKTYARRRLLRTIEDTLLATTTARTKTKSATLPPPPLPPPPPPPTTTATTAVTTADTPTPAIPTTTECNADMTRVGMALNAAARWLYSAYCRPATKAAHPRRPLLTPTPTSAWACAIYGSAHSSGKQTCWTRQL